MAIIPCWECGAEISDQATFCPRCGAPKNSVPHPADALLGMGKDDTVQQSNAGTSAPLGEANCPPPNRLRVVVVSVAAAGVLLGAVFVANWTISSLTNELLIKERHLEARRAFSVGMLLLMWCFVSLFAVISLAASMEFAAKIRKVLFWISSGLVVFLAVAPLSTLVRLSAPPSMVEVLRGSSFAIAFAVGSVAVLLESKLSSGWFGGIPKGAWLRNVVGSSCAAMLAAFGLVLAFIALDLLGDSGAASHVFGTVALVVAMSTYACGLCLAWPGRLVTVWLMMIVLGVLGGNLLGFSSYLSYFGATFGKVLGVGMVAVASAIGWELFRGLGNSGRRPTEISSQSGCANG